MKLTKKVLREHGLINSYDIAKKLGNPFFLVYSGAAYGRAIGPANWSVYGLTFKTDPGSPWYDHGMKTFSIYKREEKEPRLQEAIVWVKEKYGVDMADRDPHGAYHPAGSLEKLKKMLEAENF